MKKNDDGGRLENSRISFMMLLLEKGISYQMQLISFILRGTITPSCNINIIFLILSTLPSCEGGGALGGEGLRGPMQCYYFREEVLCYVGIMLTRSY